MSMRWYGVVSAGQDDHIDKGIKETVAQLQAAYAANGFSHDARSSNGVVGTGVWHAASVARPVRGRIRGTSPHP
jgi:hypothetical protein